MSRNDKHLNGSADDYLGFGAPVKAAETPVDEAVEPENDEESYVDSWYQVLKAQAGAGES